jgi:hypothetical protein
MRQADLHKLVDQLHVEGYVRDRALAERALNQMDVAQPWYVRAMVGFGAWLASLMLISFIVGLSVAFDGGYFVIGGIMVLAGCYARRKNDSDFMVQASLAAGLSGQALFAYGLNEMLGHDIESEEFLLATFFTSGFMFWIFPDRTLRVLEALFMTATAVILIYVWELKALIPLLGPAMTAAMVYLQQTETRWIVRCRGEQVRAAMTGLMLGAFGCVLLSAVYLLPELADDLEIYPRPWLSTLLLGALLLYVGGRLWPIVFGDNRTGVYAGYALTLAVIASAWVNPGLILALIVIILGASSGSRALTGAGIGFLAVFTAMYFYGIEISLLTKSMTLVATGVIILFARWLILKLAGADSDSGQAHA